MAKNKNKMKKIKKPEVDMVSVPQVVMVALIQALETASDMIEECEFKFKTADEKTAISVDRITIDSATLLKFRNELDELDNLQDIVEENMQNNLIEAMKSCPQNDFQSIYDHGYSVQQHLKELLDYIYGHTQELKDWRLPQWLIDYKDKIRQKLLPTDTLLTYALYHDCGKPFCRIIDEQGKQHFPNHAEISAKMWREAGGDEQIARLISMDMDIHLLKADQLNEFCQRPEAISLLLSGLAEIHANAKMFGGMESISFKIKWKHLDKRGKQICHLSLDCETT